MELVVLIIIAALLYRLVFGPVKMPGGPILRPVLIVIIFIGLFLCFLVLGIGQSG